jgi:hypothetical protein
MAEGYGQNHSSQILLFFEDSKYCVLNLKAGLVQDGIHNTGKMNLYKFNSIYFPDDGYYNSNKFPKEWMEIFDPKFVTQQ